MYDLELDFLYRNKQMFQVFYSGFWGNFRFRACKDGKRFDNFLINLSSFEILIVFRGPDGSYRVIVTFPAQFHQNWDSRSLFLGRSWDWGIFWSVDSKKHIGYKMSNIWRLGEDILISYRLNCQAGISPQIFIFTNFTFYQINNFL